MEWFNQALDPAMHSVFFLGALVSQRQASCAISSPCGAGLKTP